MESPLIINKANIGKLLPLILDAPQGAVIVFDKPCKWTSSDVVRKVKFKLQRELNQKKIKVGHAGTLDPLATGVLLVCVGKATKHSEMMQAQKKEYIAEIRFGATTPSFDLEKEIDCTYPFEHITVEKIKEILPSFLGEQEQIPPIFSAKFIDGVRAYEMARSGETIAMKSSLISIYNLEIIDFSSPNLLLKVECSKGTYIRALARDLGIALESGAHLTNLIRSSSGNFRIGEAVSMEEFENSCQF